jgi:hypothetical protein
MATGFFGGGGKSYTSREEFINMLFEDDLKDIYRK